LFPGLADERAGYEKSSGALRFPVDQPLPAEMVNMLIAVRLRFLDEAVGTTILETSTEVGRLIAGLARGVS